MVTRKQLIDYGSYALAIIGIIYAILQSIQGYLTVEQLGTVSLIMVTLSQLGTLLSNILEKLEETETA